MSNRVLSSITVVTDSIVVVVPLTIKSPATDKFCPTYKDLAIAAPPAVVIVPPFVELVAFVVLDKDKPPDNNKAPTVELVEAVDNVKLQIPSLAILNRSTCDVLNDIWPEEIEVLVTIIDAAGVVLVGLLTVCKNAIPEVLPFAVWFFLIYISKSLVTDEFVNTLVLFVSHAKILLSVTSILVVSRNNVLPAPIHKA